MIFCVLRKGDPFISEMGNLVFNSIEMACVRYTRQFPD